MIPKAFQNQINRELKRFFAKKRQLVKKHDIRLAGLVDQVADLALRGGKKIRPYLANLGFLGCGGKSTRTIYPALLAIELHHTYLLIHDDIFDQAKTRRSGLTIHAHFTQNLRNIHLATSLAILAGDLCACWTQELFDEVDHSAKARQIFNHMREQVLLGQSIDIWGMQKAKEPDLLKMYMLKSGVYSVEKPLLIGACLATANKKQLYVLSKYGQAVGLAFQLRDDWLDLFSSHTGKPIGGDIREGKWTLLIAKTYHRLKKTDRAKLVRILKERRASETQITWVKNQMTTTGVKQDMEKLISKLVLKAQKPLKSSNISTKKQLADLASNISSRDK